MKFTHNDYKHLIEQLQVGDVASLMDTLNHRLEGCVSWQRLLSHPGYMPKYRQLLADDRSNPIYAHIVEQHMQLLNSIEDYVKHSHAENAPSKKHKL